MNDAFLVRGLERLGDLTRDLDRLAHRDRTALETHREIVALDQFHGQEAHAFGRAHAEDGGDVRMVERGEHARLAFESRHAFGVTGERLGQHLDRDVAAERGVGGPPHDAHPSLADLLDETVVRKITAGGQGHGDSSWGRSSSGRGSIRPSYGVMGGELWLTASR